METLVIIFLAGSLLFALGFVIAALFASGYRADIEKENQLLAGRNRELELEIKDLQERLTSSLETDGQLFYSIRG